MINVHTHRYCLMSRYHSDTAIFLTHKVLAGDHWRGSLSDTAGLEDKLRLIFWLAIPQTSRPEQITEYLAKKSSLGNDLQPIYARWTEMCSWKMLNEWYSILILLKPRVSPFRLSPNYGTLIFAAKTNRILEGQVSKRMELFWSLPISHRTKFDTIMCT